MSTTLYRKPRIGQEINAYCGKCKDERTHIVSAMDGEVVRKVTCSMCKGTHNYKQKPAEKEARPRAPRASSRSKEPAPFAIDPKRPIKAYSMDTSFGTGDVINHPKFGLGAVESTNPPNKIEVRFQEGKKTLLHNMKNMRP
ncbi:MAG TPA: hypothetical protein VKC34_11445 [Blastocatellia bacterium]|nr:hypothetical protein [Blastocatellia bacterium]